MRKKFIYFFLAFFLGVVFNFSPLFLTSGTVTSLAAGKTITIDPGHSPSSCGVTTSGASGEMKINWEIAKKLETKLRALGYNAVLTKNSLAECVSNKRRAEIASNNNSALLLRIHVNGGGSRGYFMMTPNVTSSHTGLPSAQNIDKGNTAARAIVNALDAANSAGRLGLPRNRTTFRADSYGGNAGEDKNCPKLLIGSCYSKVPVTLIEMGNVNNSSDRAWLTNSQNQELMATALADGITAFAGSSSTPASTSVQAQKGCAVIKVGSPNASVSPCPTKAATTSPTTGTNTTREPGYWGNCSLNNPCRAGFHCDQKYCDPDAGSSYTDYWNDCKTYGCKNGGTCRTDGWCVFGSSVNQPVGTANLTVAQKAVELARNQIGKKYVWAACHGGLAGYAPPRGCPAYDCSGLVRWAWYWATSGKVNWLQDTATNWERGRGNFQRFYKNQLSQIQIGDLVYFGRSVKDAYHVAIYSGGGKIIHAKGRRYGVVETTFLGRNDIIGFIRPRY